MKSKKHIIIGIDKFGYFIKYKKSFHKLPNKDKAKLLSFLHIDYRDLKTHKILKTR